jgi:alpha-galactosidase
VTEHPEYFISLDDPGAKNLLLNLGDEVAWQYCYDILAGLIDSLKVSIYRQDFNFQPLPYWRKNDTEERKGITEIKHIRGMYELWDRLIEANPGLIIDNCASGGRRIDIESIRRTQIFFRSDYQCNFNEEAEVLQVHNSNISQLLPYNGCTTKTKGDVYSVRSSYSSCWGGAFYNAVFQSCDGDDLDWIKKYTDEYRSIRRYMSCDFYNHCSSVFDPSSWCVWQYHDPEDKSGVILAFRRKESPFEYMALELKGVSEAETLVYEDVDQGQSFEGDNCLNVILGEKRSCKLIKYRVK